MRVYKNRFFSEVYRSALYDLMFRADHTSSPRNIKIRENIGISLEFQPENFIFENSHRSSKLEYINGELEWYFKGLDDVAFISKYSKFWKKVCNEDGSCNSAYGKLIFIDKNADGRNQYQWALDSLKQDTDSRQAIMLFNRPKFQYCGNKDFVCTSYLILFIRDGILNMNVHMRSNDVILGTPNDVAFFSILHQQICRHINQSGNMGVKLGSYTHIVDSLHIYENKFESAERMLELDFVNVPYVLDYDIIDSEGNFLKLKNINF